MHWKDTLYFSWGERNAIIVLSVLIILVLLSPAIFRYFQPETVVDFSEFEQAVRDFESKRLQFEEQSAKAALDENDTTKDLIPFAFDPNTLTQDEWQRMGVPAYISRSIQNFINAGGSFRYKEDFARIYLVDEKLFAALKPYIKLPSRPVPGQAPKTVSNSLNPQPELVVETPLPLNININIADTIQLRQLYGIGPVFSRRIVSYRESLGGFYCQEQLLEVFGMDSVRLENIREHITIDKSAIRMIDINTADFEQLLSHPYIGYNVANSIIAMRKVHGTYNSVDEILRSEIINDELFEKLQPYLKTDMIETPVQQHFND